MELNHPIKASSFAGNNIKLCIPIYQRLFVWDDKQIGRLLDDLHKSFTQNPNQDYYIGTLTVWNQMVSSAWDVIDGQQRMTFLSLFAAYSIHKCSSSPWIKFLTLGEKLRIEYSGRQEDQEDLKSIRDSEFEKVNNQNFKIFLECIKSLENVFLKTNENFKLFANYVYEHCAFLVSELPNEYDVSTLNKYFETMNTAGRQLTPVDQIRGEYFYDFASIFDAALNFEKKFESKNTDDKSLEKSINEILNEGGEVPAETPTEEHHFQRGVVKPEIMLLHVLKHMKVISSEEMNPDNILKIFSEKSFSRDKFIEELQNYRVWLDNNIIFFTGDEKNSWQFRNDYETEANKQEEDDDMKKQLAKLQKKLKQYQTMMAVSSNDKQEWVLEMYETNETQLTLDMLVKYDQEKHPVPELCDLSYGRIDRYWFWKLDYLLWEMVIDNKKIAGVELDKKEKEAILAYTFKENRSIEHLHPQMEVVSTWESQKDSFGKDSFGKDSFGNLAMISSAFNSTQHNDSVGVKFQRLKEYQLNKNSLESIKLLIMFKLAEGEDSKWTPGKAKDHGKAMHELLKSVFA